MFLCNNGEGHTGQFVYIKDEREEQESSLRQEQAMREYLIEQRRVKEEPRTLSYSCIETALCTVITDYDDLK